VFEDGVLRHMTDQRTSTPRVRQVYICVNEVEETPANGGYYKADAPIRCNKPLIYYMSSSKEDFKKVWDIVVHAQKNPEMYEKEKIFGVGDEASTKLNNFLAERATRRSTGAKRSRSVHESTFYNASQDEAPALSLY
jgi:hypothetical protein